MKHNHPPQAQPEPELSSLLLKWQQEPQLTSDQIRTRLEADAVAANHAEANSRPFVNKALDYAAEKVANTHTRAWEAGRNSLEYQHKVQDKVAYTSRSLYDTLNDTLEARQSVPEEDRTRTAKLSTFLLRAAKVTFAPTVDRETKKAEKLEHKLTHGKYAEYDIRQSFVANTAARRIEKAHDRGKKTTEEYINSRPIGRMLLREAMEREDTQRETAAQQRVAQQVRIEELRRVAHGPHASRQRRIDQQRHIDARLRATHQQRRAAQHN